MPVLILPKSLFGISGTIFGYPMAEAIVAEAQRLFREGVMRESVIVQEILEEGRQEGERSLITVPEASFGKYSRSATNSHS